MAGLMEGPRGSRSSFVSLFIGTNRRHFRCLSVTGVQGALITQCHSVPREKEEKVIDHGAVFAQLVSDEARSAP